MGIAIGTTPTINIAIAALDFETVVKSSFKVYFKQPASDEVIVKEGDAIEFEDETHTVKTFLTQNDTLGLKKGKLNIEVRWLFEDLLPNGEHSAGKTAPLETTVTDPVLKNEVITDD